MKILKWYARLVDSCVDAFVDGLTSALGLDRSLEKVQYRTAHWLSSLQCEELEDDDPADFGGITNDARIAGGQCTSTTESLSTTTQA